MRMCSKCRMNEGLAEQFKLAAQVRQKEIEKLLDREHTCDVCAKVSPNVVVLCDDCDPTVEGDLGGAGSGVRAVHEKMSAEIERLENTVRELQAENAELKKGVIVWSEECERYRQTCQMQHGVIQQNESLKDQLTAYVEQAQ